MILKKLSTLLITLLLTVSIVGCSSNLGTTTTTIAETSSTTTQSGSSTDSTATSTSSTNTGTASSATSETTTTIVAAEGSMIDTTDLFSNRDLEQTADLTDATTLTLQDNQDINITQEGVYVITGSASNVTVTVNAPEDAKVQLVLDNASITNTDTPAIYVIEADKVFVTTTDSENTLSVTGTFVADGETNLDAVIFSKSDLVMNGLGILNITSATANGISAKDELKFTGGTYNLTTKADSIEANDSILVYDGVFNIDTAKDGLHSENEDDTSLGYIYILNGTFTITAADDAIHGTSLVQIDGGTITVVSCMEGIEGTYIQINDGTITISSNDDGINASNKSSSYDVVIEVNGGNIDVTMASGDTDGFDANGSIYINGGTISVTGNSAFDADVVAQLNGGDVTVNGSKITEIVQTGPGGGGFGGGKRH